MRSDEPDCTCDEGKAQHHGDKDGAGAVGQPLHGRARTLRLFHHARDLRQHCGLAQRFSPANHGSVVVERSGKNAAAGLARQRSRLAGEHRLVHGGAAFQNFRVHRKPLARQDQNAVANLNLSQGNDSFLTVPNAAGGDGP